jgi:hypothetical protein
MATARSIARQLSHERGLDIRNPSSAVFGINSRDRFLNASQESTLASSPFDCVISSKQNFMTGYFERLALTEFVFTWGLYTLNLRNNVMYMRTTTGAVNQVLQIWMPPGWYVPTTPEGYSYDNTGTVLTNANFGQIIAPVGPTIPNTAAFANGYPTGQKAMDVVFQAVVRATGAVAPTPTVGSFTCAARPADGSFLALSNTATTFALQTWSNPPIGTLVASPVLGSAAWPSASYGPVPAGPVSADATTLFDMMGWQDYNFPAVTTQQISGSPSMIWTKFVDVVCTQLTANQEVQDGNTSEQPRNIIARVYLAADALSENPENLGSQPFKIYRQWNYPKQVRFDPLLPISGFLKFELFDDAGNILTSSGPVSASGNISTAVANQPDWQMTLLVSEV